jgi:hypothetical protein
MNSDPSDYNIGSSTSGRRRWTRSARRRLPPPAALCDACSSHALCGSSILEPVPAPFTLGATNTVAENIANRRLDSIPIVATASGAV